MRKLIPFFILLSENIFGFGYQKQTSRGYVKTRLIQQYSFIFGQTQFFELEKDDCKRVIAITAAPIYTCMRDNNIGDAFLIDKKSSLIVAGDDTAFKNTRDIRAEWIGGNSETVASLSLDANQELSGLKMLFQIPFSTFIKSDCMPNWCIGIRPTFVYSANQLNLKLNGVNSAEDIHIRNFFKNQTSFDKIDGLKRSNIGFESIALTIEGLYRTENDKLKIYYYTGLELPTSETYSTLYMFYPYIGNNGNLATLLGFFMHGYFAKNECNSFGFIFEIEDHFLLYKTMKRVFDLYRKPWSRYLPVTELNQNTICKDVSAVSNLPVRVHPCNSVDGSIGIIYEREDFYKSTLNIATGYNLWVNQNDYPELQDRVYKSQYQEFYSCGLKGSVPYTTASFNTISQKGPDQTVEIPFVVNDLDLLSICAEGGYSQSLFLRATINGDTYNLLTGGWTEFGLSRVMPSRYGFWIGLGITW